MPLLSWLFASVTTAVAIGAFFMGYPGWALVVTPAVGYFVYRALFPPKEKGSPRHVLELGGVKWNEDDFCRGWEIDGRTGSGKTASAVIPIIHALKRNRPNMGILALDTKGDLSEPIAAIARDLDCEKDLVQLEVRPDNAPPGWKPPHTVNFLADPSVPYSTYAKILVDVATAAGQKGGQAFFKNAAQIAIQNTFSALAALRASVTIDNCFTMITHSDFLKEQTAELAGIAKGRPHLNYLVDYYADLIKQPPEQLGGIRSTVFNYLQPFVTPDISEVFCPISPTFDLAQIDQGKLITVKIPQKYQVEKKYVSLFLKVMFYLHALRRYDLPAVERSKKNLLVMVLDEAQETVLISEDGISDYNVVDKIRGARATTINSTQSPTSYIPPMGNREKAEVFLLNLGNKIYFTAADKEASMMIADAIGKRTIKKRTYGRSAGKSNTSWTDQDEHWIKPHELRALPKHVAILKHCEQRFRKVRLSPSLFTAPPVANDGIAPKR
jgi:hypothetical protein